MELAIVDVGHGNSAVLVDDGGVVVIDAGPGDALLNYLAQEGISRIDVLLISHADTDHIAGLIGLLATGEFEVGKVRLNSDAEKNTKRWNQLLYTLEEHDRDGKLDFDVSLTAGHTGDFDQGSVRVEILGPRKALAGKGAGGMDGKGRRITTNSNSAVIRLTRGSEPLALLAGDVDEAGLQNLIETGQDLRCFLLVFPHHGGRPGNGDPVWFAETLAGLACPQVVVFSIGRNRSNNPRPEIVEAVRRAVDGVRIACTQLSTHCASVLPTVAPAYCSKKFGKGWQERCSCAGTILLSDEAGTLTAFPESDSHERFIRSYAPGALCMRPIRNR